MTATVLAGKYQLTHRLGAGAMGTVWAARNILTQRDVAIKLLIKDLAESEDAKRRMLREASACGRLNHRNVVQVYDVGSTDDDSPFLVMELLRGESLAERIARGPRVTIDEAVFIAQGVLRALAAAHAAGIVHRDLKPANVFLHDDGHYGIVVKVVDFGISKVLGRTESTTMTGMSIGSPAYMSPEQAKGETRRLDHRSDLWSFGILLFELVTGRRPFLGETAFEVVSEILKGAIPRASEVDPEVDPKLSSVIDKCLVRDIEGRFATAEQALALIDSSAAAGATVSGVRSYVPMLLDPGGQDTTDLPERPSRPSAGAFPEPSVAQDMSAMARGPLAAQHESITSTTPFHAARQPIAVAARPRPGTAALVTAGVVVSLATATLVLYGGAPRPSSPPVSAHPIVAAAEATAGDRSQVAAAPATASEVPSEAVASQTPEPSSSAKQLSTFKRRPAITATSKSSSPVPATPSAKPVVRFTSPG